jgi:hypothetical protein
MNPNILADFAIIVTIWFKNFKKISEFNGTSGRNIDRNERVSISNRKSGNTSVAEARY